jgi:hypothetical protein
MTFLRRHRWEAKVQFQHVHNPVLGGGRWWAIGCGCFTPKKTQYLLHRRLCVSRDRSELQEMPRLQRHSIPRLFKTYRPCYRDSIVFWIWILDNSLSLNFKVLKTILIMQLTFLNWIVWKMVIPKFLRILLFEKHRSSTNLHGSHPVVLVAK